MHTVILLLWSSEKMGGQPYLPNQTIELTFFIILRTENTNRRESGGGGMCFWNFNYLRPRPPLNDTVSPTSVDFVGAMIFSVH